MVYSWIKKSRIYILLFLVALIFITGSVSGQSSDGRNPQLKVIQLSPGAEPVDVFVDGDVIGTDLGFGELAGTELKPGLHEIVIVSDNVDITRTVNLSRSRYYTLTVNNRVVSPDTTLLTHNTKVADGRAKIRLAHFSPDLLEVNADVTDGSSFSVTDLNYLETSEYLEVSPGDYTVEVTETRVGGASFSSEINLRANTSYTAFISGLKAGQPDQRLRIIPVSGRLQRQVDDGDNGNGNGDNGDTDDDEDTIRQDFSLVCRFEDTASS